MTRLNHLTAREMGGVADLLRYFDQVAERSGIEVHGHFDGENGRLHFTYDSDDEGATCHILLEQEPPE